MTSEKEAAESRIKELESSTVASDKLALKEKECETLKREKEKIRRDLDAFQNVSTSQKDKIEEADSLRKAAEVEKQKLANKLDDLERKNHNLQESVEKMKRSSEEKSKDAKIKAAE